MTESPGSRGAIHAELDRARNEFRCIVGAASPGDLAKRSDGTRWTNRQLLFHMLFGYLITRNLLLVVKLVSRLPAPAQRGFVWILDAATRPFHLVNYWGSCVGGRLVPLARMPDWLDGVVASLHRLLDAQAEHTLRRSMPFPTRWDPFFADTMTLLDVHHYATLHFEFHRQQLTIGTGP